MDLSVIIVCYRGWEKLGKCLDSLSTFAQKNFSMEAIVVDNNSGDGQIDIIESRYQKFRVVRNSINGGYGYGCNRGADKAAGEYILILNPDTIVSENEIEKLLGNAKLHKEYSAVSCRQVRDDGTECRVAGKFPGLKISNLFPLKPAGNLSFPDWISGSLMLMPRATFNKLNGFDEDFWMYSEDVDLCKRLRCSGGEIIYYSDITILHNHGGSSRSDSKTTAITKSEVQISRHVYLSKHIHGVEGFILHFLTIADNLITGLLAGITGLVLFLIPKLFVRIIILVRLTGYYSGALLRRSWVSPRSVNSDLHGR